jgi:hypothetical protein
MGVSHVHSSWSNVKLDLEDSTESRSGPSRTPIQRILDFTQKKLHLVYIERQYMQIIMNMWTAVVTFLSLIIGQTSPLTGFWCHQR